MLPKPVGDLVTLRANRWDGPLPDEGDFLKTDSGRCYRIIEIRPARKGSKSVASFLCMVLEDHAVSSTQEGVWGWWWTPRKKRR